MPGSETGSKEQQLVKYRHEPALKLDTTSRTTAHLAVAASGNELILKDKSQAIINSDISNEIRHNESLQKSSTPQDRD